MPIQVGLVSVLIFSMFLLLLPLFVPESRCCLSSVNNDTNPLSTPCSSLRIGERLKVANEDESIS